MLPPMIAGKHLENAGGTWYDNQKRYAAAVTEGALPEMGI